MEYSAPDPKHATFYLGNWWHHLHNRLSLAAPPMVFLNFAERLLRKDNLFISAFFLVLLLWLLGNILSRIEPEFATTEDRLWFRYRCRWESIAWSDIEEVHFMPGLWFDSLLIYSSQLPWYFSFVGQFQDAIWERAIFVSWLLPGFNKLHEVITMHLATKGNSPATANCRSE